LPGSRPAELAELATIVREAGVLAVKTAREGYKHWTKDHDNSPVTDADIAVDNFLRARLSTLKPDAGWLSEETEDHPPSRMQRSIWIVDPIDGTRAFVAGLPDWAVSAALIESGRPRLAALYAPVTDEMFLAALGHGATVNGKPVRASAGEALPGASIAGPKRYLERLSRIDSAVQPRPKIHSLALRLARVAQGTLDAALASSGSHDWDIAAADLLLHEAGGLLTDLSGSPPAYNRAQTLHGALVGAGPGRHRAMLALLRRRHGEFA
jgi:myo-inositol-1(or 4)-monophosphatase